MTRLETLLASRTEARDALSTVSAELEKIILGDKDAGVEPRLLTPEEETRQEEARKRVDVIDGFVREAEADEKRAKDEEEERARKLGPAGSLSQGSPLEVRDGVVYIGSEPMTYSDANPQNSWLRDMMFNAYPQSPLWESCRARLQRHQQEVEGILRHQPGSKEGRALRKFRQNSNRILAMSREDWVRAEYVDRKGDDRAVPESEARAVSTTTSSMGDFAPPLYFLPTYAPFRTYGRTLIDTLKSRPLPETGMTFNIPAITTPTEALAQTTQNTSVSTRTMVATYRSGTVQTLIDNLKVSQQYLDRVGPGIGGDQIVRDDQMRQLNRTLNIKGWVKLLKATTVGTVSVATTSAFTAKKFNQDVHKAKANIRKTDGTVAYPTHSLYTVTVWTTIEGAYDTNGRPYVVPSGVAFNPLAVGDGTNVPEGYTGFKFAGLPALSDPALQVAWKTTGGCPSGAGTKQPTVVGAFDIACEWMEGTPVIRVLPQPYAATLTVLIQVYCYWAFVPVYPKGLQIVYGTGTKTTKLTA